MLAYWHGHKNFGDEIAPVILGWLTKKKIRRAKIGNTNKILAIGSIFYAARRKDVVWGAGMIKERKFIAPEGFKVLAVRGPLTRRCIHGCEVPEVYGDPVLLLPKIYSPKVKKKYKTGIILHYIDKGLVKAKSRELIIDIQAGWKKVVRDTLSCERIISSSLHGIVCAEAYGLPTAWVKLSNGIIGGDFKFNDYFLGTGREKQKPSNIDDIRLLPPIKNLDDIRCKLLKALKEYEDRFLGS